MLYEIQHNRCCETLGFNAIETDHLPDGVTPLHVIQCARCLIEHAQSQMNSELLQHRLTIENNCVVRKNNLPKLGEDFTAINSFNEETEWTLIEVCGNNYYLFPRNKTLQKYADDLETLKQNNPCLPVIQNLELAEFAKTLVEPQWFEERTIKRYLPF